MIRTFYTEQYKIEKVGPFMYKIRQMLIKTGSEGADESNSGDSYRYKIVGYYQNY